MKRYKKTGIILTMLMSMAWVSSGQVIVKQKNKDGDVNKLLVRMLGQVTSRAATEARLHSTLTDAERQLKQYLERSYSSSSYDSRNLANIGQATALTGVVSLMTEVARDGNYPYMTRNKRNYMTYKLTWASALLAPLYAQLDSEYITNEHRQRIIANIRSIVKDLISSMGPVIRNAVIVYAFRILSGLASGDDSNKFSSLLLTIAEL